MVKILTKVPFKSGVNFRVIGDVFEAGANYKIGDLTIPKRWVSTLQDRLKTEDVKDLPLKEALESKELYLRGKLQGDTGIDWFGLVTKEFQELPLGVLEDAASKFASGPASVRYLASRERFVLEHKVAESKTGAGISCNGRSRNSFPIIYFFSNGARSKRPSPSLPARAVRPSR